MKMKNRRKTIERTFCKFLILDLEPVSAGGYVGVSCMCDFCRVEKEEVKRNLQLHLFKVRNTNYLDLKESLK